VRIKQNKERMSGKRFAGLLLGRLPITLFLILIEIFWMISFALWLSRYAAWINTFFKLVSLAVVAFLVLKDENQSYKLTWIIVVAFLPLFGGMMYLMFGNKRPSRRMRHQLEEIEALHRNLMTRQTPALLSETDARMAGTSAYLTRRGPFPAYGNTDVRYFEVGEQMFASLLEDLKAAKSYIFMEYFIVADGTVWEEVSEILCMKAREGVDVRLIYDDMGSVSVLPRGMQKSMAQAGIKTLAFNPFLPLVSLVMNHRDHRKITVIDGRIAYTGGINIADEYANRYEKYGHWKDTGLRMEGEAVRSFVVMFLNMWNAYRKSETDYTPYLPPEREGEVVRTDGGIIQPYCDSPLDEENLAENVYLDILSQAERYVYIFTPYLAIDAEMQSALMLAAKRGVDVRIVTPGVPDKKTVYRLTRSYYAPLIRAGVRIYEYAPGFLHAKSYVCDDRVAVVGTINMDYRSLFLHFECGALLMDSPVIADIKQDALATMAKSREIPRVDYKKYSRSSLLDLILRILSPML
jgi:cardiolipin synthase